MGALSSQVYTMIVAMAVVTTMVMPPSLRWMLARVPMREEETSRLEKEEAELQESVPHMERALVVLDDSPNGRLASMLAGLFAGHEQLVTTVMEGQGERGSGHELLTRTARLAFDRASQRLREENEQSPKFSLGELVSVKPAEGVDAVDAEVMKGYSIAFIGIERPIAAGANHFEDELQGVVRAFGEPVAISLNDGAGHRAQHPGTHGRNAGSAVGHGDGALACQGQCRPAHGLACSRSARRHAMAAWPRTPTGLVTARRRAPAGQAEGRAGEWRKCHEFPPRG
jgi:hypothetical protein